MSLNAAVREFAAWLEAEEECRAVAIKKISSTQDVDRPYTLLEAERAQIRKIKWAFEQVVKLAGKA